MKTFIYILSFFFSISLSAQEMFWYDVIIEVEGEDTVEFEKAVDDFYSDVDFPDDVALTFSSIALKGQDFEGTHILSFVSPSSQSLANLRASLSGEKWENYLDIVRPYVDDVRAVAGNVIFAYKQEQIGRWLHIVICNWRKVRAPRKHDAG